MWNIINYYFLDPAPFSFFMHGIRKSLEPRKWNIKYFGKRPGGITTGADLPILFFADLEPATAKSFPPIASGIRGHIFLAAKLAGTIEFWKQR